MIGAEDLTSHSKFMLVCPITNNITMFPNPPTIHLHVHIYKLNINDYKTIIRIITQLTSYITRREYEHV